MKRLFELFSNTQDENLKKTKTLNGWCPFQGLSIGTTVMQNTDLILPDGPFNDCQFNEGIEFYFIIQ